MQAVSSAMPTIVDVSSGVCGPDGEFQDRCQLVVSTFNLGFYVCTDMSVTFR